MEFVGFVEFVEFVEFVGFVKFVGFVQFVEFVGFVQFVGFVVWFFYGLLALHWVESWEIGPAGFRCWQPPVDVDHGLRPTPAQKTGGVPFVFVPEASSALLA